MERVSIEKAEEIIRRGIEAQRAAGVQIVRDAFGIDYCGGKWEACSAHSPKCCALGAVALSEQPEVGEEHAKCDADDLVRHVAVAKTLGWSSTEADHFIEAFDDGTLDVVGEQDADYLKSVRELAVKLSREYVGPYPDEVEKDSPIAAAGLGG